MNNLSVPGFFIVLAVILATGAIGGVRNWLSDDWRSPDRRMLIYKRILDATLASATIPLFLTVVGNEKTKAAFGEPNIWSADYHLSLFILVGFCTLAAIFSQRFLNSLSAQVMRLNDKVDEVQQDVEQAKTITEPLIEEESLSATAASASNPTEKLPDDEMKALKALTSGQFLVRSVSGLVATSKMTPDALEASLASLERQGLARRMDTQKGERWAPTEKGRRLGAATA